jgi:hypothetical protein
MSHLKIYWVHIFHIKSFKIKISIPEIQYPMFFFLFIFGPSVESIWQSYMYAIVDKLKESNIGENFKLCVNCAIQTMSDNETMGKRTWGLSQWRQMSGSVKSNYNIYKYFWWHIILCKHFKLFHTNPMVKNFIDIIDHKLPREK